MNMVSKKSKKKLAMVVVESTFSFDETLKRLKDAVDALPFSAEVPHSKAAENAGLTLLPTSLVLFGNPALGTPLMEEERSVGIDLPQKMLVWENDDGDVFVGYNPTAYLEYRHKGVEKADTFETIAGALLNFASIASGVDKEDISVPDRVRVSRKKGLWTEKSDSDFDTTFDRLEGAIGGNVFDIIDHGANSGGSLLPTKLIIFGNPNIGTPLMQAAQTIGIDLPLKILVWEDDKGDVFVTTNDISYLKKRHGLKGVDENLETIEGIISNFVEVATKTMK